MPLDAPRSPGYREQEIKPLCEICGEIGEAPCLRCGRPYRAEHSPPEDQRCNRCEESFERRTNLWVTSSTLTIQIGIALPYLLFGRPAIDSEAWKRRVRKWARGRFLRERTSLGKTELSDSTRKGS